MNRVLCGRQLLRLCKSHPKSVTSTPVVFTQSESIRRPYSSLPRCTVSKPKLTPLSSNLLPPPCILTSSKLTTHTDQSSEPQQELHEDDQPVPQFGNVVKHLTQVSRIFAANDAEHADLCALLDQLTSVAGLAARLNDALAEKMATDREWLADHNRRWSDQCTLTGRTPLPGWSNLATLYPNLTQHRPLSTTFMVEFVAAQILSVLEYRAQLCRDSPECANTIFGSCRNPGTEVDTQEFAAGGCGTESDYSIVLSSRGGFFQIQLNDQMAPGEVFYVLKRMVEFVISYKGDAAIPFGSLSTLPRADASFGYQFLNETGLKYLREAQFVVNLDQVELSDAASFSQDQLAKHVLLADADNVANRWFDKSIQLIVLFGAQPGKQAECILGSGVCFERSLVTPKSVAQLMQHGIDFLTKFKPIEIKPQGSTEKEQMMIKLQKLDLIQAGREEMIASATKEFALKKYTTLADSFSVSIFEFTDYGNQFIESINCEPEPWIQVATSLAYYNLRQLNGQDGQKVCFAGLTSEMVDYFEDTRSEEKLRIALESHQFHRELAANGYSMDNILRVYDQLTADAELKQLFGSVLSHTVVDRVHRPLVTVNRADFNTDTFAFADYAHQLVEVAGPPVADGFACTYQTLPNGNIRFVIGHQHSKTPQNGDHGEVVREFVEFLHHALVQMKTSIDC